MTTIGYRLKPRTGAHQEGTGENRKTYKAGDVVMSDKDLAAIFPHKFEKVNVLPGGGAVVEPPTVTIPAADIPAPAPEVDAAAKAGAADIEGRDVSARFPSVVEQDFKVFAVPGGFNVYDVDDMATPINSELITKKGAVLPFVEKFLKG